MDLQFLKRGRRVVAQPSIRGTPPLRTLIEADYMIEGGLTLDVGAESVIALSTVGLRL